MKYVDFTINLKFILILNLIILISSILIYYLYQNKNFIDFLKKQLPSDDIQIKNQITSVEDIYRKKPPKPSKPPSPPPIIPSPPKPPSPPPIIPSPPKPPTIQSTPTEIDDELQENINDAVKNVIDNINNFHQKCITDYTNELYSKIHLFTNIIENKYNELFNIYSNLQDIPFENVNGTNYCDKYIKQKEELQNNNDKINTLINDCEEIENFINDKQNKFVDIIENYKNKLESIHRSINNIISFIFNKKRRIYKKK